MLYKILTLAIISILSFFSVSSFFAYGLNAPIVLFEYFDDIKFHLIPLIFVILILIWLVWTLTRRFKNNKVSGNPFYRDIISFVLVIIFILIPCYYILEYYNIKNFAKQHREAVTIGCIEQFKKFEKDNIEICAETSNCINVNSEDYILKVDEKKFNNCVNQEEEFRDWQKTVFQQLTPTCEIFTKYSEYEVGDKIEFNWTSSNATKFLGYSSRFNNGYFSSTNKLINQQGVQEIVLDTTTPGKWDIELYVENRYGGSATCKTTFVTTSKH